MSSVVNSSTAKFGDDVLGLLDAYTEESLAAAQEVAEEAAYLCRENIERNARMYGFNEYGESWKVKEGKGRQYRTKTYIVHTPKFYRLAHLLEFGHAKVLWGKVTGGRVSGRYHIGPAARDAEQFFIDELKSRIKK